MSCGAAGSSSSPADTLSKQMAGPAIRAWHIAETLSDEHDVKLVSTTTCTLKTRNVRVPDGRPRTQLRDIVAWSDIVIFQGFVMHQAPWLVSSRQDHRRRHLRPDPPRAARAEPVGRAPRRDRRTSPPPRGAERAARPRRLLPVRQRRAARLLARPAGRRRAAQPQPPTTATPRCARCSPSSPFGLPTTTPERTRPAIKGVVPGIGPDGQGHPLGRRRLQLVRPADADPRRRPAAPRPRPDVRLFFLGMKHPNPNVPEMRMAWDARQLADELGLTDKHVFFNEEWVAYDDRQNYLLDADVGVSTPLRARRDRRSPSAPGSSTTCGPGCRSSPPKVTRSAG